MQSNIRDMTDVINPTDSRLNNVRQTHAVIEDEGL